ncbi:MAG: sigma-70 family RNA polymerase sigma factor [Desulfobacterales bacterium]|nr:sigma-70 family RNA polymerase sigma factor [Desulfobacterales bacterium]
MKKKKLTREEEFELLDEVICKGEADKFIQYYKGLIHHVVHRTLISTKMDFSEQDIEDLMQDVYESLFENELKNLKRYDKLRGMNLSRWIARLTSWTVLKSLRKKTFEAKILSFSECSEPDIEPEQISARLEAKQNLNKLFTKASSKLSKQEQQVLEMIFIDELSPKKIAVLINKKVENIYMIKSRVVKKLKNAIKNDYDFT